MRNKMMGSIGALAISATLLLPRLGEAQDANKNVQTKLADSITETRVETVHTKDQLLSASGSLNGLVKATESTLRSCFEGFVKEVKGTHTAADQTAARAAGMQNASKDYFGAWQEEVGGIANADLRKRSQRRLEDVRKSYDTVAASLLKAAGGFKPFLSNLDDVQKALTYDVTLDGVKAIRGTADDANDNIKKVQRDINAAIDELERLEKALGVEKKS